MTAAVGGSADELVRVEAFLRSIGLSVRRATIAGPTVLPGVTVDHGALLVEPEALQAVGDVLHEAGHLAVLPPAQRVAVNRDAGDDGGNELAAIAWSFAAARWIGLPLTALFHDRGYRGGASALIENFEAGRYLGVPMLEWRGMTTQATYPAMTGWLAT